jgi:hypothetical protein
LCHIFCTFPQELIFRARVAGPEHKAAKILFAHLLFTQVTEALKINRFSQHRKLIFEAFWNGNIVERLVVKINDFFASYALEMLVLTEAAIESFGVAGTFDDEGCAHFGKGQKRSIDRIQRDVRESLSDLLVENICRRVLFRLDKCLVNRHPLGRYPQTRLTTSASEKVHFLVKPGATWCFCHLASPA